MNHYQLTFESDPRCMTDPRYRKPWTFWRAFDFGKVSQ